MLSQYAFDSLLGAGGMGAVYKAVQTSLERPVAVKVLPGDLLDNEDANFVERFKNEARTMAKLSHPNIVNVFDFGETDTGLLYFVMEYIDGTDVAQMIVSQGRLPEEYALAITAHVCDALAYAHARGVIHRDIKPANILISQEGQVKVADFGLAKQSDSAAGLTKTNMAMGTPDFVAPEALIAGETVDGRADLYAVGVMLYNMLTGEIPRGRWSLPGEKLGTDPRFDEIIAMAMEANREDRYQNATAIRTDLDRILTTPRSKEAAAKGDPPPNAERHKHTPDQAKHAAPPAKSSGKPILLGIAAVALVAVGAGVFLFPRKEKSPVVEAPSPAAVIAPPKLTSEPATVSTPPKTEASKPAPKAATKPSAPPSQAKPEVVAASIPVSPPAPKPTTPVSAPSALAENPASAARDRPWQNSLGMKFVPVPGTRVLMAIHETRRRDYAAYAAAVTGVDETWRAPRFSGVDLPIGDDHPVSMISWADAGAFAAWLSVKENHAYRLPATREWLLAVGVGLADPESQTEADLFGQLDKQYPWGDLKPGASGNYKGSEDPFDLTAPVGSFQPNGNGLFDLGGNVWEWCTGTDGKAAILGCGYLNYGPFRKSTTQRLPPADLRVPDNNAEGHVAGFRIVLPLDETPATKPAPAAKPDKTTQTDPVSLRLVELEKIYLKALAERVEGPHQAALSDLNGNYTAALDRSIASASRDGKLDEALALRREKELVLSTAAVPETDEEGTPDSLKTLRSTWRKQLADLLAKRNDRAKPLNAAYDRALGVYQDELTKAQQLDGALRVKGVRDHLSSQGSPSSAPAPATPTTAPSLGSGGAASIPVAPVAPPLRADQVLPPLPPATQEEIRALCEWTLGKGGRVGLRSDGGVKYVEKLENLPKGRFTLVEFKVYDLSFTAENDERKWFEILGRVPDLESIYFDKNFGTMPMEMLRGATKLRSLRLAPAAVDDASFAHLSSLKNLESLSITYMVKQFTGAGLGYLNENLLELNTNSPTLTAEGLAFLPRFKKLRKLSLCGDSLGGRVGSLTDAMLVGLAALPDLEHLDLNERNLDGSFLTHLPANSKLKSLHLYKIKSFKSENLKHLGKLKHLEVLHLPPVDVPPDAAAALADLENLRELNLYSNSVFTGESLKGIKGFPVLTGLAVSSSPISDSGLQAIADAMPMLTALELNFGNESKSSLTPEGFSRAFSRLEKLTNIKFSGARITDEWLPHIAQCEKVNYLMLTYAQISDEGLRPLMKLPLGYLRLDGTPVTDAVIPVLQTCPTLNSVPVSETKMTPAGVAKLQQWLKR